MMGASDRRDPDDLDLAVADPAGMLAVVEDAPKQWQRALEIARDVEVGPAARPDDVIVAGMGGSGIAGDVAAVVARSHGRVPTLSLHDDGLPAWVGPRTLVVLVSHSGGTRETLSCAEQAVAAGARVVGVTSGPAFAERIRDAGGSAVEVPGELQPRASIAYLTGPVLAVLEKAEVLTGVLDDLLEVPGHLESLLKVWGRDVPTADNDVKRLALRLGDRIPWFLGPREVPAVVALRARNQVAENAERVALASELPEAGHNELVGWTGAGLAAASLVLLRDDDEAPSTTARINATVDLSGAGFASIEEQRLPGPHPLARLAAGVLFVDLLSVYLALLAGIDPTPVAAIEEFKRRL